MNEREYDKLSRPYEKKYDKVNEYIITLLALRIKDIKNKPDFAKSGFLLNVGDDKRKIKEVIKRLKISRNKDIRNVLTDVAKKSYKLTKNSYKSKGIPFVNYENNKSVVNEVENVIKETQESGFKTQAFMLRDNNGKLVATPPSEAYNKVIQDAIDAVENRSSTADKEIRQKVEEFIDSGLQEVEYISEKGKYHTQDVGAAARRNILDGIRRTNQAVQDVTGEQFGADGKEITVHEYPAPDHAPVQGHIFTNEEYEKLQTNKASVDVNGQRFAPFQRAIGTLNCRHFTFSIIIGVNKPNYTQEQLDEILERNQKGYNLPSGRHLTMYQCTQQQRAYEREIRKLRKKKKFAEISEDKEMLDEMRAKLSQKTKEYQTFSKECGLKPKMDRTL